MHGGGGSTCVSQRRRHGPAIIIILCIVDRVWCPGRRRYWIWGQAPDGNIGVGIGRSIGRRYQLGLAGGVMMDDGARDGNLKNSFQEFGDTFYAPFLPSIGAGDGAPAVDL